MYIVCSTTVYFKGSVLASTKTCIEYITIIISYYMILLVCMFNKRKYEQLVVLNNGKIKKVIAV